MQDLLNHIIIDYSFGTAITHIIAAILLFFIINRIGSHSISAGYMQLSIIAKEENALAFNFLYKTISPIVFLVLFIATVQSIGCPELTQNSYLIVIYYWIIRTIIIIVWERRILTNWTRHIVYMIISISISIWVYSLSEEMEKILPDPRELLDQLWILIIIFIYSVINKLERSYESKLKKEHNYINYQYKKFKAEYGDLISEKCSNEFYEAATYSIMIYENFNRPPFVRLIEYLHFYITKKPHTLGIMQVHTDKYINNETSIINAIKIITEATLKYKHNKKDSSCKDEPEYAIYNIAGIYNCNNYEYQNEIQNIFINIKRNYNNIDENYNEIK